MSTKKNRSPLRLFAFLLIVALGAGAWAWQAGYLFAGDVREAIKGAAVRRGPLEITVTERGNLSAENSVSIKSEVEGRATLLYLIREATQVQPGDLVAEIDTSEHEDRRVAQEIAVQSARASATKAREGLEIQRIENESQIARAEQEVEFALLELEKFVGFELQGVETLELDDVLDYMAGHKPADDEVRGNFGGGARVQELQEFRDDILLREEELKRAEDKLTWSRLLAEKNFLERIQLEADELAYTRAGIMKEQSERALFMLEKYEQPKEWTRLRNAYTEAQRQLLKANKQAVAQIADFEASKEASIIKLALEEEKLARIRDQISKGKIYAPVGGMVVYAREEGRRGDSEPMQEGGEIRERQEIITIPGEGGMIAKASIHESSLKQVSVGQSVLVTVDALPGREFHGVVSRVALLPDTNSWWANPNLRLYKTDILVKDPTPDMRPGMSCSIEILVDRLADTLYVPVQSVYQSAGKAIAWVQKDAQILEREVQIGPNNGKWLAIEGGLGEGEVVLLSPPAGFQPEAVPEEEGGPEGAPGKGPGSFPGTASRGDVQGPGGPSAASPAPSEADPGTDSGAVQEGRTEGGPGAGAGGRPPGGARPEGARRAGSGRGRQE
jgi:HlyD family secretion protein